jgi:hypothetical protein
MATSFGNLCSSGSFNSINSTVYLIRQAEVTSRNGNLLTFSLIALTAPPNCGSQSSRVGFDAWVISASCPYVGHEYFTCANFKTVFA